jgi:hypothetical protein
LAHKLTFHNLFTSLPESNRPQLLQDVGIEQLKILTESFEDLHYILNRLPAACRIILLYQFESSISKHIGDIDKVLKMGALVPEPVRPLLISLNIISIGTCRTLVNNAEHLTALMSLFPQAYRKALYRDLGLAFLHLRIKNKEDFMAQVNLLPADEHAAFFVELKDILQVLVRDINQLVFFLLTLPQVEHSDLVNAIGSNALWSFLKNGNDLAAVINALPNEKKAEFLFLMFSADFLLHVITDVPGLAAVMQAIPPLLYSRLFTKLGVAPLEQRIKDAAGMLHLLAALPHESYPEFMRAMDTPLFFRIISDYTQMINVLTGLPVQKQQAFYDMIPAGILRRIITSVAAFSNVYESCKDNEKILYLDKYLHDMNGAQLSAVITARSELYYALYWSSDVNRMRILDQLGGQRLHSLLLQTESTNVILNELNPYKNTSYHNTLLVALLRAYRDKRANNPDMHLHWYGKLFKAPDRAKKLTEANRLEAAIISDDAGFLDKLNKEQREVLEDGELGKIAAHYRKTKTTS